MFEQGHGKLDLLRAYHELNTYKPQARYLHLLPITTLRSPCGYNSMLEHGLDAQFAALDSSPFTESFQWYV